MTNLTRIVAAVVDTKEATLYKADGSTIVILQGDARLRPILEQITPLLSVPGGYADVDFSTENSWQKFEEKSNGAVRLFRIAKSKLKDLFGTKEETPVGLGVVGSIPVTKQEAAEKNKAAVAEIIANAAPVSTAGFDDSTTSQQRPVTDDRGHTPDDKVYNGKDPYHDASPDTIVAVTPKGRIVPGVERIKSQFASAAKDGNIHGMTNFLERVGNVISKRKHTVDDLLRFMERGDLPVADDGTIIIYKRLSRKDKYYVDGHSKRVMQRVGSFVHMDESLVDHNRHNECSNGLHVARRGYIRSFSGDVIVLAKVKPEDVIAVPEYDANKMRVCGYHIIAELTPAQFEAICRNKPISTAEGGEELLAKAISGDHIGIIEYVKITGGMGTNLVITPVEETAGEVDVLVEPATEPVVQTPGEVLQAPKVTKARKVPVRAKKKAKKKAAIKKAAAAPKAAPKAKPLNSQVHASDEHVSVKAVNARKADASKSLALEPAKPLTQTDAVMAMWHDALGGQTARARALLDFKKKAKKGWTVWGLPENAGDTLKALIE